MKKVIALILAIALVLTLSVSVAETYEEYVIRHWGVTWLPEDSHLVEDIDIESISIYNLYPSSARVVLVSLYEDIVVFDDGINQWILEGAEDWQVGDIASLLMFDSFTLDVKDDVVILAWYAGEI